MPTIRIDQDVWNYLQSKAKPFQDRPNDVLRRELGLDGIRPSRAARRFSAGDARGFRPDKDYAHYDLSGFDFKGQFFACNSFKDLFMKFCGELRRKHQDKFDAVALSFHGRKRVYFSLDPTSMRLPEQMGSTGIYAETNLSANRIVGICQKLNARLGHDASEFVVK